MPTKASDIDDPSIFCDIGCNSDRNLVPDFVDPNLPNGKPYKACECVRIINGDVSRYFQVRPNIKETSSGPLIGPQGNKIVSSNWEEIFYDARGDGITWFSWIFIGSITILGIYGIYKFIKRMLTYKSSKYLPTIDSNTHQHGSPTDKAIKMLQMTEIVNALTILFTSGAIHKYIQNNKGNNIEEYQKVFDKYGEIKMPDLKQLPRNIQQVINMTDVNHIEIIKYAIKYPPIPVDVVYQYIIDINNARTVEDKNNIMNEFKKYYGPNRPTRREEQRIKEDHERKIAKNEREYKEMQSDIDLQNLINRRNNMAMLNDVPYTALQLRDMIVNERKEKEELVLNLALAQAGASKINVGDNNISRASSRDSSRANSRDSSPFIVTRSSPVAGPSN